eukprot:jgi/Tetstr1/439597/TSEL_028021.t1
MKEYEPSSASSTLRGFVISTCEELERFLGLANFSSRCFGQFFFAPAGTIRAPVPPLTLSVRSSEYGKGTNLYTMKVVHNVVTLPTVRSGQWDWPRDVHTHMKKWPRKPPLEYAKPRTTIEAKVEAGLRRCWKKQFDAGVPEADLLMSAEIALYRRNVAHEEVTPAATPAGSPTPRQPDGWKPRAAEKRKQREQAAVARKAAPTATAGNAKAKVTK